VQFNALSKRSVSLEKVGKLFDLPPLDFSTIQEAGKELAVHQGKWNLLSLLREVTAQWMTSKVPQLHFSFNVISISF
jgi:hypothetical protein